MPLTDTVLLPGMVMPLAIGRPGPAAAACRKQPAPSSTLWSCCNASHSPKSPELQELHAIGTEARLLRYFTGRDGSHNAIVQGLGRVQLQAVVSTARRIRPSPCKPDRRTDRAEPRRSTPASTSCASAVLDVLGLIEQAPPELAATVRGPSTSPARWPTSSPACWT